MPNLGLILLKNHKLCNFANFCQVGLVMGKLYRRKIQPSNLNKNLFKFDGLYFWNHWEFRDVMYIILKV